MTTRTRTAYKLIADQLVGQPGTGELLSLLADDVDRLLTAAKGARTFLEGLMQPGEVPIIELQELDTAIRYAEGDR